MITSTNYSEAPGQFLRLLKGHTVGSSAEDLMASEKIKLDASEKFSRVRSFHRAFITGFAEHFADTIPTVKSETSGVDVKSVPYRSISDFWREFKISCEMHEPPIPAGEMGSYSTFKRAFNDMHENDEVTLLGGKGTFNTCSICNVSLAMKKSMAAKRDRIGIEIVRKVHRHHLVMQQNERQHAETFIYLSKSWYVEGEPNLFYICIDRQTARATVAPKLDKDRKHEHPTMENRNMGCRIVCGPIDEFMSICTGDLIPGGANVLIECARIATETLAEKLAKLANPFPLPKRGGFNFDNCGENKNKELFCWLSHLVEAGYLSSVELFFLIVGHTHNPVDRWFSVLSKAIRRADFIGSILAMQELFKLASKEESKAVSDPTVVQLTTYRDYRAFYEPVLNSKIAHFQIPARFLIERHEVWGKAVMKYMNSSPLPGIKPQWLPPVPTADQDRIDNESHVQLMPYMLFDGEAAMLKALQVDSSLRIGQVINPKANTTAIALQVADQDARIVAATSSETQITDTAQSATTSEPSGGIAAAVEVRSSRAEVAAARAAAKAQGDANAAAARASKAVAKEQDEAAAALLSLTSAAKKMTVAAAYMLDFKIDIEPVASLDIATATNQFSKRVLTLREEQFYKSCLTVDTILDTVKADVAAAEAEPWELLRLPEYTEELKLRKLKIREEQQAYAAKAEANISRILARRGLESANVLTEVLNREGFTAYLTGNIDDMNKDNLKAIAKAAGIDHRFTDSQGKKKDKKVEDLRKDVKAYLAANQDISVDSLIAQVVSALPIPGQLDSSFVEPMAPADALEGENQALPIPSQHDSSSTLQATQAPIAVEEPSMQADALVGENKTEHQVENISISSATSVNHHDGVSVSHAATDVQLCSVIECELIGAIACDQCKLNFCRELHGQHDGGHVCQFLKSGLHFTLATSADLEVADPSNGSGQSLDSISDDASAAASAPTLTTTQAADASDTADIDHVAIHEDGVELQLSLGKSVVSALNRSQPGPSEPSVAALSLGNEARDQIQRRIEAIQAARRCSITASVAADEVAAAITALTVEVAIDVWTSEADIYIAAIAEQDNGVDSASKELHSSTVTGTPATQPRNLNACNVEAATNDPKHGNEGSSKKPKSDSISCQPDVSVTEIDRAVAKVQLICCQSKRTTAADELTTALDFQSYDISFLTELSERLSVDISEATSDRRANRLRVLKTLVRKLLDL